MPNAFSTTLRARDKRLLYILSFSEMPLERGYGRNKFLFKGNASSATKHVALLFQYQVVCQLEY